MSGKRHLTNRAAAVAIMKRLHQAGHEALLAGGCVRDMLLGRRPKDHDVATDATVWQGKNVYLVDIEFTEPEEIPATIRMGADVLIQARSRVDVLLVPTAAIYSEDDRTFVEVVRDGGRAKTEVWMGISDGTYTEILAGLQEGQEVVLP